MPSSPATSAFARVTALAAVRAVHSAFTWLHANPKTILDWQAQICEVPAPPFAEQERAAWLAQRFTEIGLDAIQTDEIGNVLAFLPAPHLDPASSGAIVVLSAHLDTVFPAGTPLHAVLTRVDDQDRLEVPGAGDNGAGLAGLLALAAALVHSGVQPPAPLLFLCNVGEEGEGDLRGVRHFYAHNPLAQRVAAHIVLDGAGADGAVTQALGSRRFRATVTGPGGHSFTDVGTPNPIVALAEALTELSRTPTGDAGKPGAPRTTLNIGTMHGGTSVNSIPENAEATVDFRSTSADELLRLEVALHRAVEDAIDRTNRNRRSPSGKLSFAIAKIGDRPAARLPEQSALLDTLHAVDRHLGLMTTPRLGSTDANLPLSLGIPALSLGAGGESGGAHTLAEWYSPRNRETGLKRILLLMLAMTDWAADQ
ncbi:M20/M25/M40 family metallo-hydrolase [Terracidiphilus sp.]|jgi:acetylornithine deacetylase/succinyl-diaminopimelate desuccinylase-like protein|uniref:M20/M25/M40 family metallo-hydrolase n=1 Tax=Terracidiphilus sp. TaxID=1964191 RepID=UPI003C23308A